MIVPGIVFFFWLVGLFATQFFNICASQFGSFFQVAVEHQTTNLPFAEECIYPP